MEIFKRYVMLCVGLLIVAFGVAFSILADLGTSPISCPPYVASMLCPLTVGEATIVMHCIFILIQMALALPELPYAGRLVPCGHRACGGRCGF